MIFKEVLSFFNLPIEISNHFEFKGQLFGENDKDGKFSEAYETPILTHQPNEAFKLRFVISP